MTPAYDERRNKSMPSLFSIGYDEMISIPEGVLPADCITDVGAIDINKAFKFFIKRVRELERQREFFLSTLKENNLEVTETVVPISARLIANKASFKFKNVRFICFSMLYVRGLSRMETFRL